VVRLGPVLVVVLGPGVVALLDAAVEVAAVAIAAPPAATVAVATTATSTGFTRRIYDLLVLDASTIPRLCRRNVGGA
jgi:hypothetical protein